MIGKTVAKKVYDAASRGEVARFQQLLDEDPYLVDGASFTCSRNLLHIATLCGQAGIVEELLKISPRLARSLDSQNWSPLHIAAAEGHVEIAKKLLSVAPEMCWSRDWQGVNPIHIAAMNGHVEILQELLELDSLPAMERVHRGQTVLHLCVKHRQLNALEFLVEELAGEFVCAKDDDGDTVLHWAVRSNQVEMVRCLVKNNKVDRLAKNSMGKTAFNILTKSSRDASNNYSTIKKMLRLSAASMFGALPDMSGVIMVVVVLIATMAFQAAVSPPGGVWQDDSPTHKTGEAVMASTHPKIYERFLRNSMAAFVSSFITILLLSTGLLLDSLYLQGLAMYTMWLSIVFIAWTYDSSLTVITPHTTNGRSLINVARIVLNAVSVIFIILLTFKTYKSNLPEWLMRRQSRQHVQEDVRDHPQLALSPRLNPPLSDHV